MAPLGKLRVSQDEEVLERDAGGGSRRRLSKLVDKNENDDFADTSDIDEPLLRQQDLPTSKRRQKSRGFDVQEDGYTIAVESSASHHDDTGTQTWTIYLVTCLAAVGGFMFGYDTGIVSGAMLLIIKDLSLQNDTFKQELIVSSTLVGCIIAALGARYVTEEFGRKPAVLLASIVFTIGAVLMGISRELPSTFLILVVGRFVVGLGVGLASMVTPMYIAEVAPSHLRGKLVSLNVIFITGGQFISCLVAGSLANYNYPHGWQLMLGLSGVPAVLQAVGLILGAPESPRWLAKYRGREQALYEEARLADESFRFGDLIRTPALRRILFLGSMMQAIQQLSGINTVMYYSGTIVVMAGWTNTSTAIWMTAAISAVGFVCTLGGMALVDRKGRRFLTLASLVGIILFLALLGVSFFQLRAHSPPTHRPPVWSSCASHTSCYDCTMDSACGFCGDSSGGICVPGNSTDPTNATACDSVRVAWTDTALAFMSGGSRGVGNSSTNASVAVYHGASCPTAGFNWGYLALVGVGGYLAFFQAGMGQMPWTINSEIFPLKARSTGLSVTTLVNWVCNLLISFTFLDLCKAMTVYGTFWLYGAVAFAGLVLFYVMLPETKGKSLEEIEAMFKAK